MNKGFVRLVILIIIALIVLKLVFDVNVINYINSPKIQSLLSFLWSGLVMGWELFVGGIKAVWNFIVNIFNEAGEVIDETQ